MKVSGKLDGECKRYEMIMDLVQVPVSEDNSDTEEYEFGMATLQLDSLSDDVETEWTEQIVARNKMLKM
jgi:hypothetical protein